MGSSFIPSPRMPDQTREALAIMLRAGNAGSNTAADHVAVIDRSLAQIPDARVEMIDILIRADSAGAACCLAPCAQSQDHIQRAARSCSPGRQKSGCSTEPAPTVRSAEI